ncbi:YjjW family glycine radical enzyme activase [Zooshikella harenae]|uniref:YjjW family glycine radical enzyme activase n=1 Tax=Zooshikella harenae TaxID=2827238 RepID=A0ABS5Z690_9GAMM|nr:YjjW family glycine radical enzyme activase [Zooshikella harenae]MBU2709564.1 YjjW family glycine radical enzyme activase [Zooshikella harenae]
MNSITGRVSKIIPFSCVDGPGSRMVIFLQGCNFDCINCHNPHTIGHCDHCGECIEVCEQHCLQLMNDKLVYNPTDCIQCEKCIDRCPRSANPTTRYFSVDEIMQQILKVTPFISGITFSGGESTLQYPFIIDVAKAIKNDPATKHLSIYIDSNGSLPISRWELLDDYYDKAMIDLKAIDDELHKKITGRSNNRVCKTINYLAGKDKLYEIRYLLIPELNDKTTDIYSLVDFYESYELNVKLKIMGFQQHGVRLPYREKHRAATIEDLNYFYEKLLRFGLTNITLVKPLL